MKVRSLSSDGNPISLMVSSTTVACAYAGRSSIARLLFLFALASCVT